MDAIINFFALIIKIVMTASFVFGCYKIIKGWFLIREGQGSVTDILVGAGCVIVPTLMYLLYIALFDVGSKVDPYLLG